MSDNRIEACFHSLKVEGRRAFIAFLTAGDPSPKHSLNLLDTLVAAGVDIIEIGLPFSDPMADGATIQASSERALKAGTKIRHVFQLVEELRQKYPALPILLMGYANPVHKFGVERFAQVASRKGADGVILVDVPMEEETPYRSACEAHDLALIRLIAPTSRGSRLRALCEGARGFLYAVSVTGTTGRRQASAEALQAQAASLRAHSGLPIAAGFGIASPQQARAAAKHFDAIVVGSALIEALRGQADAAACARLSARVAEIRRALVLGEA